MKHFRKHNKRPQGFSLVEMIIYIFILTLLLFVIVNLLSSISDTRRAINVGRSLDNSMVFATERLTREIRNAISVDTTESVLNINPGKLVLNSTDSGGLPRTLEFFVSDGVLRMKENNIDIGPITQQDARVTNLIFRHLTTPNSSAVKMEMEIEAGPLGKSIKTKKNYDTIILRGILLICLF